MSLGNGLLRAAVSIGILGCVLAGGTVCGQTAATPVISNPVHAQLSALFTGTSSKGQPARANWAAQVKISQAAEFEVVVEDEVSIEMCRADIEQRTLGSDRVVIRPNAASKAARITRPNISAPLLE